MVLYYLIKRKNRNLLTVLAVAAAVIFNGLFSYFNDFIGLPIFLDSIFTVMAAALFGLWPGIITGALTNLFIELLNGFPGIYYPFAAVNIATALMTSLFVNTKRFETPTNAFWLIIILSLVNSLLGALIVTIIYEGFTNLSIDHIVRGVIVTGRSLFSSAFFVRIVVNIVDKGIAVLISYFIYKMIQIKADR